MLILDADKFLNLIFSLAVILVEKTKCLISGIPGRQGGGGRALTGTGTRVRCHMSPRSSAVTVKSLGSLSQPNMVFHGL